MVGIHRVTLNTRWDFLYILNNGLSIGGAAGVLLIWFALYPDNKLEGIKLRLELSVSCAFVLFNCGTSGKFYFKSSREQDFCFTENLQKHVISEFSSISIQLF